MGVILGRRRPHSPLGLLSLFSVEEQLPGQGSGCWIPGCVRAFAVAPYRSSPQRPGFRSGPWVSFAIAAGGPLGSVCPHLLPVGSLHQALVSVLHDAPLSTEGFPLRVLPKPLGFCSVTSWVCISPWRQPGIACSWANWTMLNPIDPVCIARTAVSIL